MNKIILLKNGVEKVSLNLEPGHEYFIGRDKSCDIVLDNLSSISRKHAKVSQDDKGQWKITNLSKNSSLLFENESVDEIKLEDSVTFGIHPFKFQYVAEVKLPDTPNELIEAEIANSSPIYQHDTNGNNVTSDNSNDEGAEDTSDITAKHELIGSPYLKFIAEDGSADYLRLEGNLWTAGSDRTCEIVIQDRAVNPQHFQIFRQVEGFFIKDLNSALGTFINGQKIPESSLYQLSSGDLINVNNIHIQFEIRDTNFLNKIKELPLQVYKNPMIFSDEEDILSLPPPDAWKSQEGYGQGAVPISKTDLKKKKSNGLRTVLLASIALMVIGYAFLGNNEKPKLSEDELKHKIVTYEDLVPQKKKFIAETYKLVQSLYHNAKFELALLQLNKIHEIIPSYKDSRELEKQCILSRELLRENAQKEQERHEREELKRKVDAIIEKCYDEFKESLDVTGATLCFEPAKEINPSEPRIIEFLTDMEARAEKDRQTAATLREYQEKLQEANELFNKALSLYKQKKYHEALDAFEEYMGSGLPDPDNNMEKSKRAIATIRKSVDAQKIYYLQQARVKANNKNWREAILTARRAQEIDPYDYSISNFIYSITTELHKEMKKIFLESLIEEGFGNIEAAKVKWVEVMQKDIPTSDFYIKASRKLEQYGF